MDFGGDLERGVAAPEYFWTTIARRSEKSWIKQLMALRED
jgi:hypothetical protein